LPSPDNIEVDINCNLAGTFFKTLFELLRCKSIKEVNIKHSMA